jgi:Fe-S-cluster containining protein
LHTADRDIVVNGALLPTDLVTIRTGELAFHPVKDELTELSTEIIKIRGRADSWTCRFYQEEGHACAIYDHRPLECRLLECWDPAQVEALFLQDLLTRQDLIPEDSTLWELISAHEASCSPGLMYQLIEAARHEAPESGDKTSLSQLLDMDAQFRGIIRERLSLEPRTLDFYFGRPLAVLAHKAQSLIPEG